MAKKDLSFHVRQDVFPDRIIRVLQALSNNEPIDEITQSDRQIQLARELGLITETRSITESGQHILAIYERKPALWGDLGHFLHYTLWDEEVPNKAAFSWLYREYTNYLWSNDGFKLGKSQLLNPLCLTFNSQIEESELFQPYLDDSPSLSPDSLAGVKHWLDAVTPAVIESNVFTRRVFCPPELLLLAIGWAFRHEPAAIDTPLLLSHSRRETICRLCLLDPKYFERALDWLVPRFPKVIQNEDQAGFYGRTIRLRKRPSLEDLI